MSIDVQYALECVRYATNYVQYFTSRRPKVKYCTHSGAYCTSFGTHCTHFIAYCTQNKSFPAVFIFGFGGFNEFLDGRYWVEEERYICKLFRDAFVDSSNKHYIESQKFSMKSIVLVLIFFLEINLINGQSNHKTSNAKLIDYQKEQHLWHEAEILDADSIFINNKVPYLTKVSKLRKVFGLPDSITPNRADCCTYWEDEHEKDIHYGKTIFLAFKDSAIIDEMFFYDGRFYIKTPKLILSNTTTYKDACKVFPKACKLTDVYNDSKYLPSNVNNRKIKSFSLKICKDCDDVWNLYFNNNKLIRFEYGTVD